ncbi:hypothetical protein PN4B1_06360 [Paenibacillus naphthalenovorans]|uniref:YugN-like family protein n=1 Tax=Paenibacillus naphthalenovorans TaxID=162209 RepID=UPI0010B8BC5E|nr:YugN-like family protein [Paenibacillus naphthalenovorans]GCL70734.1 hypothetical protein PN4B1_06360 [Paenibacillus naphthalenovorans]
MIPLDSSLLNREENFDQVRQYLHEHEFVLGGNWDYEHGSFDRYLDEGRKVWLRIPFQVTHGVLDGDADSTDAVVQIGTPFVLKHVYNEGLDEEAQVRVSGALIDQFQEPLDNDAPVEDKWVAQAKSLLKEVEQGWSGDTSP